MKCGTLEKKDINASLSLFKTSFLKKKKKNSVAIQLVVFLWVLLDAVHGVPVRVKKNDLA